MNDDSITMKVADLRDLLIGALAFTHKGKDRGVLHHVEITAGDDAIVARSTNSYSAITGRMTVESSASFTALVSREDVTRMIAALKAEKVRGSVAVLDMPSEYELCLTLPGSKTSSENNVDIDKFPTFSSFIPSGDPVAAEQIGVSIERLALLAKVPSTGHASLVFHGPLKPFIVDIRHETIEWQVVMTTIKN